MLKILTFALLLSACAHRREAGSRSPNATAEVLLGTYSASLLFPEGKARLTEEGKQDLNELAARAQRDGRSIEEIKVLAWADKEYPENEGINPTDKDVSLAEERARAVRTYLREDLHARLKVDTFNMARRPGRLSEWLGGEDYEVKKAVQDMGPTATTLDDGSLSYSKASKALVIVDYQDD